MPLLKDHVFKYLDLLYTISFMGSVMLAIPSILFFNEKKLLTRDTLFSCKWSLAQTTLKKMLTYLYRNLDEYFLSYLTSYRY